MERRMYTVHSVQRTYRIMLPVRLAKAALPTPLPNRYSLTLVVAMHPLDLAGSAAVNVHTSSTPIQTSSIQTSSKY